MGSQCIASCLYLLLLPKSFGAILVDRRAQSIEIMRHDEVRSVSLLFTMSSKGQTLRERFSESCRPGILYLINVSIHPQSR